MIYGYLTQNWTGKGGGNVICISDRGYTLSLMVMLVGIKKDPTYPVKIGKVCNKSMTY